MKSSNHNREKHKQDLRKAFTEKDAHGIKAKVGCSTHYTLICAAKKQCALCKVQLDAITQGDHPKCATCKLAFSIKTAEAAYKKFDRRNKIAFDCRERRRELEREEERREGSYEGELHGEEPSEFKPLGNALKDALESARPTRW